MGSYIFTWKHPAREVYVTGTFDDWTKSERLDLTGDIFSKNVLLPRTTEKIYYKFLVDGNWVTDATAPQEIDKDNNLNNFLTPDQIIKITPETVGIMSGVTPNSTTASLVGAIPLENKIRCGSVSLPGTFPETPAPGEETAEPKILRSKLLHESDRQHKKEDPITPLPSSSLALKAHHETDATAPPSTGLSQDPNSLSGCSKTTLFMDSIIQSAAPQSSTAALVAELPKISRQQTEKNHEDKIDNAANNIHARITEPKNKAYENPSTTQNKFAAIATEPSPVQCVGAHLPLANPHELVNVEKPSGLVSENHPNPDIVNQSSRELESQNILTKMAKDVAKDIQDRNTKAEQYLGVNRVQDSEEKTEEGVISRDFGPVNKVEDSTGVSTDPASLTASQPVSPNVTQQVAGSITEQTTRLSIPDDDVAASTSNSPTITDKKKKRTSFFGKLKAKLIYKDKE